MNYSVSVGQKIRSYDFRGDLTCFMEGVITKVESEVITFVTTREVFDGIEGVHPGSEFQTHTQILPGWKTRIEIIG